MHEEPTKSCAEEGRGRGGIAGARQSVQEEAGGDAVPSRHPFIRSLPLAALLVGAASVFLLGFDQYLTFEALAAMRGELLGFMESFAALIIAAFLLVQIAIAALSIPAGSVATMAGGFLFGPLLGTLLSVLGQTLGALVVFLAVRTALRGLILRNSRGVVKRFENGFRANAFAYIFALRVTPVVPAWIVNLVPGATGVPMKTYFLATLLGVIPCTAIFSSVGNGMGVVLDAGKIPDWSIFLAPEIAIPLAAVTVLSLLAPGYRFFERRHGARASTGA